MKTIFLLILTLLTLCNTLYGPKSNVAQLTEQNFNDLVINSNELWLVEFYAPWCGHCKNLAPEWEKAANVLKGIVKIGAIDADAYKTIGGKYGVRGFPTIKWFGLQKSNPKDYEQGRTSSEIVKFAKGKIDEIIESRLNGGKSGSSGDSNQKKQQQQQQKQNGSGSDKDVVVLDDSNFDSLIMNSNDMWLVEFYAPWCGHCKNLEPEWNVAATELKGKVKVAKLDATTNQKVAGRYDIKGYPTIKIFPPGPKNNVKPENYEGGRDSAQIVHTSLEKLEKYGFTPEVEQLLSQDQYAQTCLESGKTCIISFIPHIYESNAQERNKYLEIIKKASTIGNGKPLNFIWAQGGDNFDFEEKLGLQFGFPALLVVNHGKKKYAIMKSSFDYENIKIFLNRILIGKESFYDIPSVIPKIKTVKKWDGKDAEIPTDL